MEVVGINIFTGVNEGLCAEAIVQLLIFNQNDFSAWQITCPKIILVHITKKSWKS